MLVKICCIASHDEATLALDHGADAIGLVSAMPSGPGVIEESVIAEVAVAMRHRAKTVLLTSLVDPEEIAEQVHRCCVNAVQLCAWLETGARRRLRSLLPSHFLMQVVHITGPEAVDRARKASGWVDALLLDSGTLSGPNVELGGTGRTHDWIISAQIRERSSIPVILAGGLNPDNVQDAIAAVRPDGVDVCSGVRTSGLLDREKLERFVASVRK